MPGPVFPMSAMTRDHGNAGDPLIVDPDDAVPFSNVRRIG
jgi:hypothetical protein